MRLLPVSLVALLVVMTEFSPVLAQGLSVKEANEVCIKSPMDTQCQGEAIALDDRPGEAGACTMIANDVAHQTVCKVVVTNQRVTAYYELGPELESLRGDKATREIQINPSNIKSIGYKEGEKDNTTAKVVNAVLFGLGGLFGTRNKEVSEIAIEYTTPLQSSSGATSLEPKVETAVTASETVAPPIAVASTTLKIVVRRRTGKDLRQQLEQLTGISAITSPSEQPRHKATEVGN